MKVIYPHGTKSEWLSQAKDIKSGCIQTSESDIPMLLEWLQDMNWPGAEIIAKHLLTFESSLIEPMRNVLKSNDIVWINWVLSAFESSFDADFWKTLAVDLESVAYTWDEEGAHIYALQILARWQLASPRKIAEVVSRMKQIPDADLDDYDELDSMIEL